MATLYITELASLGPYNNEAVAPPMPALREQCVSIETESMKAAPTSDKTRHVMIVADAACSLGFNEDAVTEEHRLPADETRFYTVNPGTVIAVIANS